MLAFVLGPASALTGIPIADVPRLEAMRLGAGGAGENAAPWIHLYAATIALVVLVPRLLLGTGHLARRAPARARASRSRSTTRTSRG